MKIQRYTDGRGYAGESYPVREDDEGEYVGYADYAALAEQLNISRRLHDAAIQSEMVWEKTMMEACGEDGPASVAAEIKSLRELRDTALESQREQVRLLTEQRDAVVAESNINLQGAARELNTSWMMHKTMLGAQAALLCISQGDIKSARDWLEGTTDEAFAEIPDDMTPSGLQAWFDGNMVSEGGRNGFLTHEEALSLLRQRAPATESAISALQAEAAQMRKIIDSVTDLDNEPEYHESGMGCGLEDRNITDRYEAMRHGWEEAMERVYAEVIPCAEELSFPATDAAIAALRAEGAYFVANRMLAAWEAGFIDDTAKNAADIARMILTATEFMAEAPAGDFDRSFADGVLDDIARQLRESKGASHE